MFQAYCLTNNQAYARCVRYEWINIASDMQYATKKQLKKEVAQMEASLITLKLFLDELEIPTDIETVEKRKLIQKAVYLGQRSGVDLGYRFSWYLMGPYSTSLTQDYYKLVEALNTGDSEYQKRKLKEIFKEKLNKVKEILKVPSSVNLSKHSWLELLASWDYLENISKFSELEIKEKLKKEKPDLCENTEEAKIVLKKAGALLSKS